MSHLRDLPRLPESPAEVFSIQNSARPGAHGDEQPPAPTAPSVPRTLLPRTEREKALANTIHIERSDRQRERQRSQQALTRSETELADLRERLDSVPSEPARPAAPEPDSAALGEARSRIDARLAGWVSAQEREALAQALVRSPAEGLQLLELRAATFGLPDAFTLAAEKRAGKAKSDHTDTEGLSLSEAADLKARTNHDGNDAA